jgi:hypothetical protein
VIPRTGLNVRYCNLVEMQGMAFVAQLTAGAMSKWDTATAAVTLGSGIPPCVTVAVI